MDEETLYNIKRKTVPFSDSIYGRSPLHKKYVAPPKQYSEVDIINQQHTYKQNYHNPHLKDLMHSATQVLLKLIEKEKGE